MKSQERIAKEILDLEAKILGELDRWKLAVQENAPGLAEYHWHENIRLKGNIEALQWVLVDEK